MLGGRRTYKEKASPVIRYKDLEAGNGHGVGFDLGDSDKEGSRRRKNSQNEEWSDASNGERRSRSAYNGGYARDSSVDSLRTRRKRRSSKDVPPPRGNGLTAVRSRSSRKKSYASDDDYRKDKKKKRRGGRSFLCRLLCCCCCCFRSRCFLLFLSLLGIFYYINERQPAIFRDKIAHLDLAQKLGMDKVLENVTFSLPHLVSQLLSPISQADQNSAFPIV